MGRCRICRHSSDLIAAELGLCLECIRLHPQQAAEAAAQVHGRIRGRWGVPAKAPKSGGGIRCDICVNRCRMAEGELGYCGLRQNAEGRLAGVSAARGKLGWETNGAMSERWRRQMLDSALESGGCIKIDLKAWNETLHIALTGVSNRQPLENFKWLAQHAAVRPEPPLLIASTLLVTGYIDAGEVSRIAGFIAALNPDIPYSLLGFHPDYRMKDLAATARKQARECLDAARQAGLRRVHLANMHLIG